MTTHEPESKFIKEAKQILSSSYGHPHSLKDREQLAINFASNILKEANRTITRLEKKLRQSSFG